MLGDRRWQKRMGIEKLGAGSADTAARVLDGLDIDEMNALLLDVFFKARRAGILSSGGPQGPAQNKPVVSHPILGPSLLGPQSQNLGVPRVRLRLRSFRAEQI